MQSGLPKVRRAELSEETLGGAEVGPGEVGNSGRVMEEIQNVYLTHTQDSSP